MNRRALAPALLASAWLAGRPWPARLRADDGPAAEAATASKLAAAEAKLWTIRVGGDRGRVARALPDPVLRYSNPGVGRVHGDVVLFVEAGRPRAVFSIYKWFSPWTGFEAEMHALSTEPIEADRDGLAIWTPDPSALRRQDVPDAPPPASSPFERLAQMRTIAAGFAGRLTDARVEVKGEDQSLRLLTRPLHRFERHANLKDDGALFAFVLGTDPEFFLLLETLEAPAGPRWRYTLARMNRDPLAVTYKGREVWKVAKVEPRGATTAPYFSIELPKP